MSKFRTVPWRDALVTRNVLPLAEHRSRTPAVADPLAVSPPRETTWCDLVLRLPPKPIARKRGTVEQP